MIFDLNQAGKRDLLSASAGHVAGAVRLYSMWRRLSATAGLDVSAFKPLEQSPRNALVGTCLEDTIEKLHL